MNQLQMLFLLFVIIIENKLVNGHGMLMDPIGRGSRWRLNESAPADYNDNEAFCGGFGVQWAQNNGKCGLCGDDYAEKPPRSHELGGTYGEGIIVKQYERNTEILIKVKLTANHAGYFKFDLCNLDESKETDTCFHQLQLKTGELKYQLQVLIPTWFETTVIIPKNLKCNHCVLRWTYVTGNNWGNCEDGTSGMGCGPQENYRSCADIAII